MDIKSGIIIVPVMFNVVTHPQTCSINPQHTKGVFLVKGGAKISLGCVDCLTTQEFNERLFTYAGFTLPQ